MVARTQRKYLLQTIKKNGVSFFAVALIAATSIAIYLGIQSGAVTILECADRNFTEQRLATAELTCANGITQEDVELLKEESGVDAAEGGYQTMVLMDGETETMTVQVRSLLEELNQAVVLEGELPKAADEVAIEEKLALEQGISIGDQIDVEHEGELLNDTYRVTAIINEPSFTCADAQDSRGKGEAGYGSASYYMEVTKEAFDTSYYNDCYTTAYVENAVLSGMYFYGDEYSVKEEEELAKLETFGEKRAKVRFESLCQQAEDEIRQAEQEIAEAENKLQAGKLLMAGNATALENAQAGVEAAKAELNVAKQAADEIQLKDWVISGRNNMGDVSGIKTIVEGLFVLSYSFAMIFLLVAVVVCYAAVVKMINDQRMLIGAQKALGFQTKEIFLHYMIYNILCAVLGIIIGYIAAVVIVENLVLHVFGRKFVFQRIPLTFEWKEAAVVAALCMIIFVAATAGGCIKVVRQSAISLLRGEVPSQKKAYFFESWIVYKKLNLYSRTMIKNVLSDKGRILTTVMGVVGSISLLIITFTLKIAVSGATDIQFENYFLYQNRLVFSSEEGNAEEYEEILEAEGISFRRIQDKLENFRTEGEDWGNIRVIAVEDKEQLDGFIYMEDVETGEEAKLPDDGVLISQKCAENYDLQAGSVIELMDAEGEARECRIAGVIEHYLPYHQIITSEVYYEEMMGEAADACVFLLKGDIDGLYEKVRDVDGFLSLKDNSEYKNTFSSINLVIGICLFFSAVLAVLVLLNQMTMYINRKSTELAVMRINGYTLKETKAFVSKDNVVLVAMGLLLGCVVGTPLAQYEVCIMETGACRYIRTPNILASLLAVAVCIVFAWVINKIALRKIDHLNLTKVNGN